MTCKYCGCTSHCGQSCTNCWNCPDCQCHECEIDTNIQHGNNADTRD